MPLGRSDELQVGDAVLAIGNPLGLSQTVTHGIVSATGRSQLGVATFENFIQTDAAINAGNSGGALINSRGELIGINTAVLNKSNGGSVSVEGIGFAIPVNLARGVMKEILDHGRVIRGWIRHPAGGRRRRAGATAWSVARRRRRHQPVPQQSRGRRPVCVSATSSRRSTARTSTARRTRSPRSPRRSPARRCICTCCEAAPNWT